MSAPFPSVSSRTRPATSVAEEIDHLDGPIGMSRVSLRLARHADHARAAPARDLHGGLSDLAGHAEYQHRLVPVRHPRAPKAFDRRDERHADPGGFSPRQVLWFLDDRVGLDNEMRGMGAVAPDSEIAGRSEHFAADRAGRTIDHHTGVVASRSARKDRVRHQPGRRLDVGRIDGSRLDLDQHLSVAARQRPPLDNRRHFGRRLGLDVQPSATHLDGYRLGVRFIL